MMAKVTFFGKAVKGFKKFSILKFLNDEEMYQKCDIVIEMIDSGYWQIFSRDPKLINKLLKKFKKTKIID